MVHAEEEVHMMKWLVCKLKDHDWQTDRVELGDGRLVWLGICDRCLAQYWMKGEIGKWKGVRILKSSGDVL